MTDFAPDAVLSFFEQTQRAKERRARLWDGVPRRVNEPMPESEVRSEPESEKITEGVPQVFADMLRNVGQLAATVDLSIPGPPDEIERPLPTPRRCRFIFEHVAAFYEVTLLDLASRARASGIVRPRQVAMYLARTMTVRSFPEIGRLLGGRDHTTCLHGFRVISLRMKTDPKLAAEIAELRRRIEIGAPVPIVVLPEQAPKVPYIRRKRQFWTKERAAEFVRLWHEGMSSDALGEKFCCCRAAINKRARKLGLPSRPSGRRAGA